MAIDSRSRGNLHRPEIDGLRGLAVLAVVLYHAQWGVPSGFLGVDIFFVLSGYLITRLSLRRLEDESFSLLSFWQRRIRRIFPALFVMLAATLTCGYLLLPQVDQTNLARSGMAQSAFVANFHFAQDAGYFAAPAKLQPLLHTWSLAVEEQFYLLFPLFLLGLFRPAQPLRLFVAMLCLTLLSFSFCIYQSLADPRAAFFLLPARGWELLTGAQLASAPWQVANRPRLNAIIGTCGLLCVATPMFLSESLLLYPAFAALPPVLGTAALLYTTSGVQDSLIKRALSQRPLVFLGLISYSLYLWHWPILVFCRIFGLTSLWQTAIAIAASLVISVFSWKGIEEPFRARYKSLGAKTVIGGGLLCSLLTLVASAYLANSPSAADHYPPELKQAAEDLSYNGLEYMTPMGRSFDPDLSPRLGAPAKPNERLDFLLWGDSHGMAIASLLDQISTEERLSGAARLESGSCPLPSAWRPHRRGDEQGRLQRAGNQAFMAYLKHARPKNLILVARWSLYCEGHSEVELAADPNLNNADVPLIDQEGQPLSLEESRRTLQRQLQQLVELCKSLQIRLWIIKEVPETGEEFCARDFLFWKLGRTANPPSRKRTLEDHRRRQQSSNQILDALESPPVILLDPSASYFDGQERTINYQGDRACYRDSDHLTRWGAESMRELLVQKFREMK